MSLATDHSMVHVLEQTNLNGIHNVSQLRNTLRESLGASYVPTDSAIAEFIIHIVRNADLEKWDGGIIGEALASMYKIDWQNVMKCLDNPKLVVEDVRSLAVLIDILTSAAAKQKSNLYLDSFLDRWKTTTAQVSLLKAFGLASPDIVDAKSFSRPRIIYKNDFDDASPEIQAQANSLEDSIWNVADFVKISSSMIGSTHEIIEIGVGKAIELVFLGIIQEPPPWNAVQEAIISRGIQTFFKGHPSSLLVFYRLKKTQLDTLTAAFRDLWSADPSCVDKIALIADQINIIKDLSEMQPTAFALDVLSSVIKHRSDIDIQEWLIKKAESLGGEELDLFLLACLDFLSGKAQAEATNVDHAPKVTTTLRVDVVAAILKLLMNSSMPQEAKESMKVVQIACLQVYPRLFAIGFDKDDNIIKNFTTNAFSRDVEKEVEQKFQQLYDHEATITELVIELKKLKYSDNPRDLDVFACTLHSLFDEYRFFPDYPLNALAVTAVLFGSLIQYELLSFVPLVVALGYVYEALLEPPDSNMFRFGVQALIQFQEKLEQYQHYCAWILEIPNLAATHPDIIMQISKMLHSPKKSISDQKEPLEGYQNEIFTCLSLDELDHDPNFYAEPDEVTQDKILFAINNLSLANFNEKVKEVHGLLEEKFYIWFANYLVQKRASREPNFHGLYINLVETLQSRQLMKHVMRETLTNIFVFISSEKTISSTAERNLLKILGTWLGSLTLSRNMAIKHKNINFKLLLLEGYGGNRLIVVLPFVCKVLEGVQSSMVFKPPNPWTMGIIRLLVEMYHFADLKINLKFEIEVICRKLDLDINTLEPSTILRKFIENNSQNEESKLSDAMASLKTDSTLTSEEQNMQAYDTQEAQSISDIKISKDQIQILQNSNIKKLMATAIEQTLVEIVTPVVDRAVAISTITTKILVLKDFTGEPSVARLRTAAKKMASFLTGSLSLVTCREPIRLSLLSIFKSLVFQNGAEESQIEAFQIEQIVNDNVDLVFKLVEKMAYEKSGQEMERALQQAYLLRQKAEESGSTETFLDMAHYYPMNLPEHLSINSGGLTQVQNALYEDLCENSRLAETVNEDLGHSAALFNDNVDLLGNRKEGQQNMATLDRISHILKEIHEMCFMKYENLRDVPLDCELHNHLRLFAITLSEKNFPEREQILPQVCEDVLNWLHQSSLTPLCIEVYVAILEHIVTLSPHVAKALIEYLCEDDNYLNYNVLAYINLVKSGTLTGPQIDLPLSKFVAEGREDVTNFAVSLISELAVKEPMTVMLCDFICTLQAMHEISIDNEKRNRFKNVTQLLKSLWKDESEEKTKNKEIVIKESALKQQLDHVFMEWLALNQHPCVNFERRKLFVQQLLDFELLKSDQAMILFLQTAFNRGLEAYFKAAFMKQGSSPSIYTIQDQFAKLVLYMAILSTEKAPEKALAQYLSILVLLVNHEYNQKEFDQKPIFRIYSSLIWEIENLSENEYQNLRLLREMIADSLLILQPLHYPRLAVVWLSLISHRRLLPYLLENEFSWDLVLLLIMALFKFIDHLVRDSFSQDLLSTRLVLKGTTRIILAIVQDYPQFVYRKILYLSSSVPNSCTQLQNILLSAIPMGFGTMVNPFHDTVDFANVPGCDENPSVDVDYPAILGDFSNKYSFTGDTPTEPVFEFFRASADYVVRNMRMHALLLHIACSAIQKCRDMDQTDINDSVHQSAIAFIMKIIQGLSIEERYYFFNVLCSNLRYPNTHTMWFLQCFQAIWIRAEANLTIVQEQMTRVLLERLIPHQPHPWGLLVALHQLLKNPACKFWSRPFMLENRQISKVFDSMQEHMSVREERMEQS